MHEPGNRSKVKRTKLRPSKDVQEKLALKTVHFMPYNSPGQRRRRDGESSIGFQPVFCTDSAMTLRHYEFAADFTARVQ